MISRVKLLVNGFALLMVLVHVSACSDSSGVEQENYDAELEASANGDGEQAQSVVNMPSVVEYRRVVEAYEGQFVTVENQALPTPLATNLAPHEVAQYYWSANPSNKSFLLSPSHGELFGDAPELFYFPDSGYLGVDRFLFSLEDTSGVESNVAANVIYIANKVDVLFIGDSITAAWNDADGIKPLQEIVNSSRDKRFANIGVGGFTTFNVLDQLGSASLAQAMSIYQPKVIVLAIGLNDFGYYFRSTFPETHEAYTPFDKNADSWQQFGVNLSERYGEILGGLSQAYPETRILVLDIYPSLMPDLEDPEVRATRLSVVESLERETSQYANAHFLPIYDEMYTLWFDESSAEFSAAFRSGNEAKFERFLSLRHDVIGHLNQRGYFLYAQLLQCPINNLLLDQDADACGELDLIQLNQEYQKFIAPNS